VSKQPKNQKAAEPNLPPTVLEIIAQEEAAEAKIRYWSIGVAIFFHVMLFIIHWPDFAGAASENKQQKSKIFVVKQVKFEQPKPREFQQIPKPKTQKVPIPDPTPDEPEPIRDEQDEDDLDFIPDDNLVLGVPDAPPPPEPEGPIRFVLGGNITEPKRTHSPPPVYPEAARRARITGAVVLECTINKSGVVTNIKTLRGLPLGLTEAAVDAVSKWRFKPSTLNGKPVEVLYVLTVHFTLQ